MLRLQPKALAALLTFSAIACAAPRHYEPARFVAEIRPAEPRAWIPCFRGSPTRRSARCTNGGERTMSHDGRGGHCPRVDARACCCRRGASSIGRDAAHQRAVPRWLEQRERRSIVGGPHDERLMVITASSGCDRSRPEIAVTATHLGLAVSKEDPYAGVSLMFGGYPLRPNSAVAQQLAASERETRSASPLSSPYRRRSRRGCRRPSTSAPPRAARRR